MGQMQENKVKIVSKAAVAIIALSMILPVSLVLADSNEAPPFVLSAPLTDSFYAQNDQIRLANAQFDMGVGPQNLASELVIDEYDSRVSGWYLVKFNDAIDEYWVASLKAMGAEFGAYVPYNTYMVKMDADTLAEVENLPYVRNVGIYHPAYRVQPTLLNGVTLQAGLQSAGALDFIGWENLYNQARPMGAASDRTTLTIMLHEGENPYDLAALIGKTGGNVLGISDNSVRAEISRQGIQTLTFVNEVEYIMPFYEHELMLADTAQAEQDPIGWTTPVWTHGITGNGVIVGIADTGLNTDHELYRQAGYTPSNWVGSSPTHRKVKGYHQLGDNIVDYDGHGSHVCGEAAGNGDEVGSTNLNRFGMGYMADISFCDIGQSDDGSTTNDNTLGGIPQDLKTMYALQKGDGASMASNSWGVSVVYDSDGDGADDARTFSEGTYSEDSLNSDWFMWQNKEFLIFFSAGNDRGLPVYDGPPYNSTVTPPATGKNMVSVAAHNSGTTGWDDIMSFSSWGQTLDMRFKPDIGSTGTMSSGSTDSNRDGAVDTTYAAMQGTSMASPCALGDATLMSEYYRAGWYPVTASSPVATNGWVPSAALVKATMLNGAIDSTGGTNANGHDWELNGHTMDYPNGDQGWGMVNVGDSLYFNGDAREVWVDDNQAGLITGQQREYKIGVATGQELEFTLVWTDYPGSTATWGALVNDLDLTVIDPTGIVYYGNNFGSTSREADSSNPAGKDHINPVEGVLVKTPTQGTWTILIDAVTVPKGPQPYGIVVAGNFDTGYGWVRTDKMVYKSGDTMTVTVEDTNVATGSLSVQLTSSTNDVETITLNEVAANARKFTGTIPINANTPISGNGAISIENNGEIIVKYTDANPAHDSYANVTTLLSSPKISNVRVTDISNTAGIVKWDTDMPATSQVYYGLTTGLGSVTTLDSDMVLTHEVVVSGLTGFTNYYFDVESVSIGGVTTRDNNGGDHYMFTTVDNPDVLIIQEHSDIASSEQQVDDWELSLGYYGWSFTVWETVKYGLPTLSAMNSAKVVYWDVGEGYPQLGTTERALVQSWIGQAGQQKFYATGQDIGWDMCDAAGTDRDVAWYNTYLHATFLQDDADGGGGNEVGSFDIVKTTHAISTGFATATQDLEQDIYGATRFWPDDISILTGTGVDNPEPWDYSAHAAGGNAGSIAYTGTDYKLAYEAFAHAMIQDDGTFGTAGNVFGVNLNLDRAWIADSTIKWLMGEDHPDVTVLNNNGQGEDGTWSGTRTITWTVANSATQQVQISKDSGQSFVLEATVGGAVTSYVWDTTTETGGLDDYPNGEHYRIKILAQGTNLKAFDVSDADFTLDNGVSGDEIGPVIVAGSIKVDPLPGGQGNTITFDAQADDRAKGNSNIAAAEFFIDTTGTSGTGNAMTATDGNFNFQLEDVRGTWVANIAQGSHIVYVHARDAANNWGGYQQFTFQINEGGPSVQVTAPNTAENILSGTVAITWTATDYTDPAGTLDCTIEYSANGGTSWTVLESALNNNDGTYSWDTTTVADGVNYLVRVSATDSFPLTGTDVCDYVFSVDNVVDDRWYLQIETTSGNNDLNMMPVESAMQEVTSATMTATGDFLVGTWRTTKTFTGSNINGAWTFNVYGDVSSNIGDGVLFAVVKASGGTTLDTTIYDTEDVFDYVNSNHLFTWTDTLAGTIPDGQGVLVELYVHVTAVSTSLTLTTAGTTQAGGPHNVWFCDVDDATNSELTGPNTQTEFTDAQYTQASVSDNTRTGYAVDPGLNDEIFVKCQFTGAPSAASVSNINLVWEGMWNGATNVNMYAYNFVTSTWTMLGATQAFSNGVEATMTRSITSDFANYISNGEVLWGVYGVTARVEPTVDYIEVAFTIAPSATFNANIDFANAQSNIQPTIGGGGPGPTAYEIDLSGKAANSWVFVSFPIAISGNIQTILNDATLGDSGTTWTVAKWYNPQTPADPWKTYRTGGTANDLATITNQMGVWLWITANGGDTMLTTSLTGDYPASAVAINLYAGWNMVGYPTATSRAESATLPAEADLVASWQAASPYITQHAKGATMMVAGNAYWVHVTADCTWTVQP